MLSGGLKSSIWLSGSLAAVHGGQIQELNDSVHSVNTPSIEIRQVGEHPLYIGNIYGAVHFGLLDSPWKRRKHESQS